MERFGIDSYLYDLRKEILRDKNLNSINFYNKSNLKQKDLRKQLELFPSLELPLSDVLVNYHGKTCFTSPKNIRIILGSEYNDLDVSHLCVKNVQYGYNTNLFDVINQYIFIKTDINYSAKSSYLHEITHTQAVYGQNVSDKSNEELLPMFIELIYGYINDTNQLLYKVKRLYSYITQYMDTTQEEVRDETRKYITSTLKAIKLYHLYINSYDNEIIKDISNIFNNYTVLEDVLAKYEITLESSKVKYKELIKK